MILFEDTSSFETCCICGQQYHEVYKVSDSLWSDVTGFQNGEGMVCLTCFTQKAYKKNISIYWEGEKSSFVSDSIALRILGLLGLSGIPKPTKQKLKKRIIFEKEKNEVLKHITSLCQKYYRQPGNIVARLRDGYSVNDLKRVATIKSHDPYFQKNNWQFFNPVTLYTKKNFEIYLNQRPEDFKIAKQETFDWAKSKAKEINGG